MLTMAMGFTWVAGILYPIFHEYTDLPNYACSLIAVALGFLAAGVTFACWQIGMVLMGAMAATTAAVMILSLGDNGLIPIHPLAYVLLVLLALGGAVAILFLQRLGIMASTSVIGSFAFVVSVAACASPTGSTVQIIRDLLFAQWRYPDNVVVSWPSYVYFASYVVLAGLCFLIQWKWTAYIISYKHHDPWIHDLRKSRSQTPVSAVLYDPHLTSLNA